MPFTVFNVGSVLIVAGFTLKVLEITNSLTSVNKGAGKKLQIVAFVSIFIGLFFGLIVRGMPDEMRNSMIVAGLNIAAVGVSTILQYLLNPNHAKFLRWVSLSVTVVGFGLCYAYVLLG